MKKFGILYICTGKYVRFWKDFFRSTQEYLLTDNKNIELHYFVFTDVDSIDFDDNDKVHKIYQEPLSWPFITLKRYEIFLRSISDITNTDYLYFFNANAICRSTIDEEILPTESKPLVFAQNPDFYKADRSIFTYEHRPESTAYIHPSEGEYYFMGGLYGGYTTNLLEFFATCNENTNIDLENNIIATYNDESHLNRYAIDNKNIIKIISPSYGYRQFYIRYVLHQFANTIKIEFLRKDFICDLNYLRGCTSKNIRSISRYQYFLLQIRFLLFRYLNNTVVRIIIGICKRRF